MKTSPGFTLVEMSIVLIIIGFLIGGMFAPLSMQMNQQKIRDTKKTLETIKEALMGYAILNDRLPCPAKCYKYKDENSICFGGTFVNKYVGKEDDTDTTFCEQEGYLPWVDLGVSQYDAWGNIFRYRLDNSYDTSLTSSDTSSGLKIRNINSNHLTNETVNSNVIAIIYSCGKNGMPDATNAISGYTGANCSPISLVTKDIYTQDFYVENEFDDMLVWLPKTILINQLVSAGKWPP
ncbi:MAG: prepilin-type N-terminal cleavage/methylation domain-containing protein [Candidatus Marithrix sp.]